MRPTNPKPGCLSIPKMSAFRFGLRLKPTKTGVSKKERLMEHLKWVRFFLSVLDSISSNEEASGPRLVRLASGFAKQLHQNWPTSPTAFLVSGRLIWFLVPICLVGLRRELRDGSNPGSERPAQVVLLCVGEASDFSGESQSRTQIVVPKARRNAAFFFSKVCMCIYYIYIYIYMYYLSHGFPS